MGAEMAAAPEHWERHWNADELEDLLAVAAEFDPAELVHLESAPAMPESIRDLATEIRRDLLEGHGFTLIRGLPVDVIEPRTVATASDAGKTRMSPWVAMEVNAP